MSEAPEVRRPFSMIRSFALADVLTLGNGFCGAGAILALMQYIAEGNQRWLWTALALSPIALFLDFADGRVARWRHRSSALGADLDSLADVISFGMTPAAIAFAVGMRHTLDVVVLLYFVACGISRLARFNVTAADLADDSGKVKYFEGTPIPTSVLLVGVIAWLVWRGQIGDLLPLGVWQIGPLSMHPLVLAYAASGSLMISTLRIPKL
ncbi:MAG: CDP-diacylglycerol--serine O-phosphatidyltransferase [Myxococcales bacterium]